MTDELKQRVKQALKDGQELLWHWQKTVSQCEGCKKLQAETAPYLAGLTHLLGEVEKS